MRLSDLFHDMHLATLGVVALVLFFVVFAAIAIRTVFTRRADVDDRLSRLPLAADEPTQETRP